MPLAASQIIGSEVARNIANRARRTSPRRALRLAVEAAFDPNDWMNSGDHDRNILAAALAVLGGKMDEDYLFTSEVGSVVVRGDYIGDDPKERVVLIRTHAITPL